MEAYTVGNDYLLDMELIGFDIQASKAHAEGLQRIGVLSADELKLLQKGLNELANAVEQGEIEIKPSDEDCHTYIENFLVEKYGDIGKKIHTGRSRNDQVLTALRLYMRSHLDQLYNAALDLSQSFKTQVQKYKDIPMPGYSHTQQAMLSSVGHYFAAFFEALKDDAEFAVTARDHINKNPLGSAAGFGVTLPLDREFTTKQLEFNSIQTNSLYCQNSRGKFESIYLEAFSQVMLTLGKFANDMLMFTSNEFAFFDVSEELVTGSSIMPQKKNLDGLEVMRSYVNVVLGQQEIVKNISKNLFSGYNRDLQLIKEPLFKATEIVLKSIEICKLYLLGLTPRPDIIKEKISKNIFAADIANELVEKQGIPFRNAYQQAMDELQTKEIDIEANLKAKRSLGSPGNLGI